jgi:hypothetical protein
MAGRLAAPPLSAFERAGKLRCEERLSEEVETIGQAVSLRGVAYTFLRRGQGRGRSGIDRPRTGRSFKTGPAT